MRKPRLKRSRPAVCLSPADFPMDEFLRHCPLPAELAHLEPLLRGPIGQSMLDCIVGAMSAGMTEAAMLAMLQAICEFHSETTHRCSTCFRWTDAPAKTGGLIANGSFHIIVTCRPCYERIMSDRATPEMVRNLRSYGGGK